jgi:cytochrome c2
MSTEPGCHEQTDLSVRGVLLALAALAAVVLVVQLVVGVQFAALRRERARENPPAALSAVPPEGPPEPRLQTTPAEDLAAVRAQEDAILHGYGWEDRAAGVVHIPVERAMELVAREGDTGASPVPGLVPSGATPAASGAKLFADLGCSSCHGGAQARCPDLAGLLGRTVTLASGQTFTADEGYVRESIFDPGAKIVAGYENIMPTYKGLVTEDGVLELIAYIKALHATEATGR